MESRGGYSSRLTAPFSRLFAAAVPFSWGTVSLDGSLLPVQSAFVDARSLAALRLLPAVFLSALSLTSSFPPA